MELRAIRGFLGVRLARECALALLIGVGCPTFRG